MERQAVSPRSSPVFWVFVTLACLYLLSLGRGFYTSDGDVMFLTTAALADRGTFELAPDPGLPQIVAGTEGRAFSKYDPGMPLLMLPFYAAGDAIGEINAAHRYRLAAVFVLAVPALAAAAAAATMTWLSGQWFDRRWALSIGLAAGLATPLWPYARTLFPEAVLACALTVSVGLVATTRQDLRRENRAWIRLLGAGAILGFGMLTRAALAIYALPLALLVMWPEPGQRVSWRESGVRLAIFGLGMLSFVLALAGHNALRFGNPLHTGYVGEGFTAPVAEGVGGLLLAPGRSVFLYAPPLVLSGLLWARFRRRFPVLGMFLALAWAVALVFNGAWWAWHGGWCWGPRLVVPLIPLSCLPWGVLPGERGWRRLAVLSVLVGIAMQLCAVTVDITPHYAEVLATSARPYQRINWIPAESPLVAAVARLVRGQTEPLAVFHLKSLGLPASWWAGLPLVLISGCAIGLVRLAGMLRGAWAPETGTGSRPGRGGGTEEIDRDTEGADERAI